MLAWAVDQSLSLAWGFRGTTQAIDSGTRWFSAWDVAEVGSLHSQMRPPAVSESESALNQLP